MGPTLWNVYDQLLGPTLLPTFDEWVLLSALINGTMEASGDSRRVEGLLQTLLPVMPLAGMQPGWLAAVPDTPQVRAFAAHMSAIHRHFADVFLGTFDSVRDAVDAAEAASGGPSAAAPLRHRKQRWANATSAGSFGAAGSTRKPLVHPVRLWAVLEFKSGPARGGGAEYAIRMDAMNLPSTFTRFTPFNAFYEYGSPLLGLLTACSFALPLAMAVRAMVTQRVTGLQHMMHILGLAPLGWQAAWAIALQPVMLVSFSLEGLLAASTYLRLVQPSLLAVVFGAAALSCSAWAVLLGSVFSEPRAAPTGSFLATLLASVPFLALQHYGASVALLGRNAAGKSTLMAVASGRMAPSLGGCVWVAGLTAQEHLELALVLRGVASPWEYTSLRQAAERLADAVSLPQGMLQALPEQLSGGSQRKLQLAMCMAGEPAVLLLDEVTAGVDSESRQAIWQALLRAKRGPWGAVSSPAGCAPASGPGASSHTSSHRVPDREAHLAAGSGAALLFTSHHLAEVAALADNVAVLEAGCVQSVTPAATLHAALCGSHRVLRVITRPVPATPAPLQRPRLLTRSQLVGMVRCALPPGQAGELKAQLEELAA
ncbi:hypothetical protein GPECTOR_1g831 [Gonium pectorale]|uniref:ABC transporter domain-containing protein n=1 Tax=Gonium pectorale TaxID=33097 RepID=A0A150H4E0_GONPE|nr:hypothetical protein GPECTOR_1g831 [Gonium pectorale]|eukprot:KXZ56922.1 hypothetical protein GPECTOR_1g831 [Gonium pectorale]